MLKLYDHPSPASEKILARIAGRGLAYTRREHAEVSRILEDVRRRGDRALVDYTRRFDCPTFDAAGLRVTTAEMEAAAAQVDRGFLKALRRAASQVEVFHRRQLRTGFVTLDRPGTMLGQLVRPVGRAGVYVPGGRGGLTPLVSSVLMGAIPARVAGVERVAMVTPPTTEGSVAPALLVAARTAGVDEVYKAGSAWAVAALAFGTETIPRADVVVGPGNLYVALAKKIVAGTVGVDIVAGPSEILVVADDSATPEFVAADLLAQAEHDAGASAVLVTPSRALGERVRAATGRQLEALARREIAAESLRRFGAVLVTESLPAAFELADRLAPEHLELHVREPLSWLGSVRNAGAVFVGEYTPEAIGDYVAGPNHVLPTAGTARFASALSVDHFLKRTSVIHYSEAAFRREAQDVLRLAAAEGLGGHARSVSVRLDKKGGEGSREG
jgi:histidinol dehydrogenase